MSLVLNALPDPHQVIRSLQNALLEKSQRVTALEEELHIERQRNAGIEVGVTELQTTLEPLYRALQIIFRHLDGMSPAMGEPTRGEPPNAKREVWDSWKKKLGGLTGQAIDVLMLHGPMNQSQLRIQLACATRSVSSIVTALNKAGLIDRVDGKIALKRI